MKIIKMNKKVFFVLALLTLFVAINCKKKSIAVSMVAATSIDNVLPHVALKSNMFSFLGIGGEAFKAEKDAQYVKIHIYPDEPIEIDRIYVDLCSGLTDRANAYINFDENYQHMEKSDGDLDTNEFSPVSARSVTINFRKNKDLCVNSIKLYRNGSSYDLHPVEAVKGNVIASSTLDPRESYDVMNLFDSRFEHGWASDKSFKNQSLQFSFEESQRIDQIKIWNGYQRSDVHCYANSRAKTIELVGDNGYSDTIHIQDIMGPQTIDLNKAFVGKNLTLKIKEAFRGRSYKDLVISELRFGYQGEIFMISPLKKIQSITKNYRNKFQQANLGEVLNHSLRFDGSIEPADGLLMKLGADGLMMKLIDNMTITLRLRSDGSFFSNLRGEFTDYPPEPYSTTISVSSFSLGGYEVKSIQKSGINIRIFGFIESYEESNFTYGDFEGDCNGCGRDCNRNDAGSNTSRRLFQEYLLIKPVTEGGKTSYSIKSKKGTEAFSRSTMISGFFPRCPLV